MDPAKDPLKPFYMWQTYALAEGVIYVFMNGPISFEVFKNLESRYYLSCSKFHIAGREFQVKDGEDAKAVACEICISEAAGYIDCIREGKTRLPIG